MSKTSLHDAIQASLDSDEIAISWVLVVDVAGPDETRYLGHRAGGGHDGESMPMSWQALGMMQAAALLASDQVRSHTVDRDDPEGEDDD